jgi:hypothetical protein
MPALTDSEQSSIPPLTAAQVQRLAEILDGFYQDACMALDDSWDRSNDGFEVQRDLAAEGFQLLTGLSPNYCPEDTPADS